MRLCAVINLALAEVWYARDRHETQIGVYLILSKEIEMFDENMGWKVFLEDVCVRRTFEGARYSEGFETNRIQTLFSAW